MPAQIRDVMPAFELYQPTSVADTMGLLQRHGADAWIMAGGMDTFDWLKDRIRKPKVVVDLSAVAELKGIKEANGGLEIGSMTTLTELSHNAVVKERYGLLAEAAGLVASPLLVLPGRLAVLSRRRQHLLRGHANVGEPRARHLRRGPLRGGEPVGYGSSADRARRPDGDQPERL